MQSIASGPSQLAYSVDDAARVMGIRPRTLWRMVQDRKITAVKIGGPRNTRILAADIENYLQTLRAEGTVL